MNKYLLAVIGLLSLALVTLLTDRINTETTESEGPQEHLPAEIQASQDSPSEIGHADQSLVAETDNTDTPVSDTLIGTIDSIAIYRSDLSAYIDTDNASQQELIDAFKATAIILANSKRAEQEHLAQKKEVKALLDRLKNSTLSELYLNQLANEAVNESAVKQEYNRLKQNFAGAKEYRLKHILLQSESEAQLIEEALGERSFENLARMFSLDASSATNGGDLGYVLEEDLDPAIAKRIISMRSGEVSEPFSSRAGWNIIKLEDKRPAEIATYNEVKLAIQQKLIQQYIEQYQTQLRNRMDIPLNQTL